MTTGIASVSANPLERLAATLPANGLFAISVVAKLVGAGFALWYAYDQDTLFPGEHFLRTWAFVALVSIVAAASSVPLRYPGSAFVAAVGAGVVLFGGANLAERGTGIVALACGLVAALTVLAWNARRGAPGLVSAAGILAGGVITFVAAIAIAFTIEN